MNPRDAERQEWERAIELLGRSTRPGRLLEFLGTKYFQQQEEQLTEIDIATQVFGRSAKNFDPSGDAVVRVEAHRLRKKLRDIYEKDDRTGGMQISLPAGTYVPQFTASAAPAPDAHIARESFGWRRVPTWAWFFAVIGVILSAVVGIVMSNRSRTAPTAMPQSQPSQAEPASRGAGSKLTEVHLLAGNSGSEVIDNSGVRWTPDRFFAQGGQ